MRHSLVILFVTGVLAGPVQVPNLVVPASAVANKQAVVDIFTESYQAYRYVVSILSQMALRRHAGSLPLAMTN
jgi:hypothetical protein